jgi:predicted kinase
MGTPTLIIVSGPAGSGKTTLAHALAAAVGCPALCRDEIKEGMVAAEPGFVAGLSDPLSLRTYDVFFAAIRLLLDAEVTLVAEAAFQHPLWDRGLDRLDDLADLRIVRCRVDPDAARARMERRLAEQITRAAHADAAHLSAAAPFDAIHREAPTLDVDTTDGYDPRLDAVVAFCR